MAIYNPKRARELEAAARLADSQRQRELARGQREQKALQQTLGLVESLIGAAPQVVGGLQDVQAQQVLAGEKPLPEQKPKSDDILENISRFITDPFEAGVRQKARAMAQEQKGARLQTAEPLLREAIQKPGLKPEFAPEAKTLEDIGFTPKEVAAQLGADPREAAMKQLMRDPALALLPEREREAAIVGLQQRMTAEQAAAATAAEERASKLALEKAKAGSYGLKLEKEGKQIDPKATILEGAVDAVFEEYKDRLNVAGDSAIVNQAKQELRQKVMQQAAELGMDTQTDIGLAAIEKVYAKKIKEKGLSAYKPKDYEKVRMALNLYEDVKEVDRLRRETKFEISDMEILQEELDALDTPLGLDSIEKVARSIQKRAKFTERGQYLYVRKALELKNTLMKAANDGYNVTNMDAARLAPIVLNPNMRDEEWSASVQDMLRGTAKDAKEIYAEISGVYQAPAVLREKVLSLEVPEKVDVSRLAGMKPMTVGSKDIIRNALQGVGDTAVDVAISVIQQMKDQAPELISGVLNQMGLPIAPNVIQQFIPTTVQPQAAAPQTSQQQVQQQPAAAPTAIPPPQKPTDMDPEVFYLEQRQGGNLNPSTQSVLIVDTDKGRFLYVVDNDKLQAKQESIKKITPNVGFSVYTGNEAGGL